jgi:Ca-activated chloride channel homolog
VTGYGVAVATLIVALAKPQATVARPTEQARVMIVTDRSGSMLAQDVAPNRLAAAKKAASWFLAAVPDEVRVGAIAFNQKAEVLQSPTRDHDAVREALGSVEAAGTTATGDAIEAALESLDGDAPAAIVLLSDGKRTTGGDPVAVAHRAKRLGVRVTTVALGDPGTELLVPGTSAIIPVPPDPETMREIARASGGRFFAVDDADRLNSVYEGLGTRLTSRTEHREITAWFAGFGALLLLLAMAASVRRFAAVAR